MPRAVRARQVRGGRADEPGAARGRHCRQLFRRAGRGGGDRRGRRAQGGALRPGRSGRTEWYATREARALHALLAPDGAWPCFKPSPSPSPSPSPRSNSKPNPNPSPNPNPNPNPKQDLGHVFGFPLWERAVFRLLHRAFAELHAIFTQYAKPLIGTKPRPDGSLLPIEAMHGTELTKLAHDCELQTDAFPMARIQAACAAADSKQGQGEGGADRALELHEFLEVLVRLSFLRANPRFGEVANGHDAPAHPLPECLEQMLSKSILKQSKQASLGKVKMKMP